MIKPLPDTILSKIYIAIWKESIQFGPVTPSGDTSLSQYWLRLWLNCYVTAPRHYLNQCLLIIKKFYGIHLRAISPGSQFNIRMTSYQYRESHCGDKTILRPSYLHNGISYTGKITSLYWIMAQKCSWTYFVTCVRRYTLTTSPRGQWVKVALGLTAGCYILTHWGRDKMVATLADDTFKCKFVNENILISIKMSLKFVPKGPINNMPALV